MTTRQMTISYQHRYSRSYGGSGIGSLSRDLPTAPKLIIANHILKKESGFDIGNRVEVEYLPNSVIIRKLN